MKNYSYHIVLLVSIFLIIPKVHAQNTSYGVGAGTGGDCNTSIGYYAGEEIEGDYNVCLGHYAGKYSTEDAGDNILIGYNAGLFSEGNSNVMIGNNAGMGSFGASNVFIGKSAGYENFYGHSNIFIGRSAGYYNQDTHSNVFIGTTAGHSNIGGSSNVFIGDSAGYYETGSHKLYIANSSTSTPLIYGEFNNNLFTVHGKMGIGAKPINNAMLRLYNSSLPTFDIASDSARLEVGVSTCSNCFAPGSRPGDVVFRALGLTHSILFSIPSSLNDGNRYIGFFDHYNGIWVKILNDRKFRIDGTLIAKEIKIQTDVWSDFVFDPNYTLRPLDELEAFINENRHLPEVPPTCQVLEEGIDVSEMNVILLQKVEELTLYTIKLNKELENMQVRINKLEQNK